MKYLDYPILNHLSYTLSSNPSPELRVHVRFEAYSVKPIGKERKMYKEMEEAYVSGQEELEEMSFSPEMREAGLSSCFGRLDEKESRKVHFLLVSTLNAAFPDHDFTALRPDHFTREPSAAQVLAQLSGTLGPGPGPNTAPIIGSLPGPSSLSMSPIPGSPSSNPTTDLYRTLCEVVPLDESEVYSWFPEPEYDPHIDAEDGEASEDGFELDEEEENVMGDMDLDEPSWGQAGMELDVDLPQSVPMMPKSASPNVSRESDDFDSRRLGSLLWSTNYFFYSRRQKRVLFLTCWCRKRPIQPAEVSDQSSFPAPISASLSSPPAPLAIRHRRVNHARATRRKSKPNLKPVPPVTGTIPIRGMETPRTSRLASSAPSTFPIATPSPSAAALARMTAGGFKPRTPARMMLSAARASAQPVDLEESRVRKDRSESTTPGPGSVVVGVMDTLVAGAPGAAKGKRVKV